MKIWSKLYVLPLVLIGFAAQAQTETVAPAPRKLEQLYISVGTGPAITLNNNSHPWGGTYLINFTAKWGTSLLRLNLQHNEFASKIEAKTNPFSYLKSGRYDSDFFISNENTSVSLAVGLQKKLNNLVQLQGFSGIGFNHISEFQFYDFKDTHLIDRPFTFYRPGVLLQAEAMFLPSKFAGLTLGAYANMVSKMPTAGLNFSLNLGKMK